MDIEKLISAVLSFPRKRESSEHNEIPAFAGMTNVSTSGMTSPGDDEAMLVAALKALVPAASLFVPMLFAGKTGEKGTPPEADMLDTGFYRDVLKDMSYQEFMKVRAYLINELSPSEAQLFIEEVINSREPVGEIVELLVIVGARSHDMAVIHRALFKVIRSGVQPEVIALALGEIGSNPNFHVGGAGDDPLYLNTFLDRLLPVDSRYKAFGISGLAANPNLPEEIIRELVRDIVLHGSEIGYQQLVFTLGRVCKNPNLHPDIIRFIVSAIDSKVVLSEAAWPRPIEASDVGLDEKIAWSIRMIYSNPNLPEDAKQTVKELAEFAKIPLAPHQKTGKYPKLPGYSKLNDEPYRRDMLERIRLLVAKRRAKDANKTVAKMEIAADHYKEGKAALKSKSYMIALEEYEEALEKARAVASADDAPEEAKKELDRLYVKIRDDIIREILAKEDDVREKASAFKEKSGIIANLWLGRANRLLSEYSSAIDHFEKAARDLKVGSQDRNMIMAEVEDLTLRYMARERLTPSFLGDIRGTVEELRSHFSGELGLGDFFSTLHRIVIAQNNALLVNDGEPEREVFSREKAEVFATVGGFCEILGEAVRRNVFSTLYHKKDYFRSALIMYGEVIKHEALRRDVTRIAKGIKGHFADATSKLQNIAYFQYIVEAIANEWMAGDPSRDALIDALGQAAGSESDPVLKELASRSFEAIKSGGKLDISTRAKLERIIAREEKNLKSQLDEVPYKAWQKGVEDRVRKAARRLDKVAKRIAGRMEKMDRARRERWR